MKNGVAMTNKDHHSDTSDVEDTSTESQEAVQERLNRIANKAAKRARIREESYDAEHDVFIKQRRFEDDMGNSAIVAPAGR